MAMAYQIDAAIALSCRNSEAAFRLKLISIFLIFFTSVLGISSPVVLAHFFQRRPFYDKAILVIKCFAAGVILSTALVHVLPDAYGALGDCQLASKHPWKDFPFTGFVTLVEALLGLLVDVTASARMEGHGGSHGGASEYTLVGTQASEKDEELVKLKQRLASRVLEIGIIFHSLIIGVTMGMSQNQCTIRPLIVALAFHHIFEGMGLGGCIAQAGFGFGTMAYMGFMFSVTTPIGIGLGMIIFSLTGYDDSNPNALIVEGLLGSLSSGVLIYTSLFELIAADFFQNKLMSSAPSLKRLSFVALTISSGVMSILALWA